MRTMDPARVHASFDAQLTEATNFYHTVKASLSSAADVTRLSASTMISAATLWESFLSDLLVAYINRDPTDANSRPAIEHRAAPVAIFLQLL